jgi:cytochrome P450
VSALTPLTAAAADDPYTYYAELVSERPFYFDDDLRFWVASSARVVLEALASGALRVRPAAEAVPRIMEGTAVGEIFARMVRMSDGERHGQLRQEVSALTDSIHLERVGEVVFDAQDDSFDALMFEFPVHAVTTLLGVQVGDPAALSRNAGALARAIAPGSTRDDVLRAGLAVDELHAAFKPRFGDDTLRANAIALLFQTHDATAGLIGNALVHLAQAPSSVRALALHDEDALARFVAEIARLDSPVHNTRRFAAENTQVGELAVSEGDVILLLLAAANRDPQGQGETFTFGAGRHACIAARLAIAIACSAILRLVAARVDVAAVERRGFLPAQNVRIPKLGVADRVGRRQT